MMEVGGDQSHCTATRAKPAIGMDVVLGSVEEVFLLLNGRCLLHMVQVIQGACWPA